MDFAELPPEINSARIYSGPGSAPLMQAAAAWARLSNELNATAATYEAVIAGLSAQEWQGASALSMAAAAAPYVAWMKATAAQAEQAAAQAVTAANAYESAYAATVPPVAIAANRTSTVALAQTNIFGQNTPAIASNEADYGEMWAQDIVAMDGYAGTSAAASELTPFTPPPATTTESALTAEPAAAVSALTAPAASIGLPTPIGDLDLLVAAAVVVAAVSTGVQGAQLVEVYRHDAISEDDASRGCGGIDDSGAAGGGNISVPGGARADDANPGASGRLVPGVKPPVAALSGYSSNAGGLSVPQSWYQPPAVRQIAAMFPNATPMYMTGSSDGSYAGLAAAGLAGTSVAGLAARGSSSSGTSTQPTTPGGGAGGAAAAAKPAANQPAIPAAAAGAHFPGLPAGLPPGVVANLAATLAAIPGATIIVVPPNPNQ
ncbi:PPE family protein [Mycobacterium szulgai]|uniref:PPE family protein n=1 Tax=Mycobacterium szulgai TaxID=1787 RepID=A0A1X2DWF7_MYCSZ|nr:PPE family protein [Mycobacterium szulgai]MCV7079009.1 PPE family protein [Mycobacterium szulgai]ORW92390.1 hypothetical protein AWC27_09065 [Mycobacterium szulgai]